MLPERFQKVAENLRNVGLTSEWKVVCPPTERDVYRPSSGNRAFELTRLLGQLELDDTRWAITNGWFEREDGVKVYPVYGGWYGSKTNPKPEHLGWYVTWADERIGILPECGPYAAMKAVDKKWSVNKPVTGRMALLFDDEMANLALKPQEIPPSRIRDPLSLGEKLQPIASVLRQLASQENCDGEPYDQMMQAAARLDWLEAEVARLQGSE